MNRPWVAGVVVVSVLALGQRVGGAPESDSGTQIDRLWRAFGGDWRTAETHERDERLTNGGERSGMASFRLAADGAALVEEGHSEGTAGTLSFLIVFWWDENARLYRLLTCFHARERGCEVRGTGRWDGEAFVNDYEEDVGGKRTKLQDIFSHITPTTFTLVAAMAAEDGSMAADHDQVHPTAIVDRWPQRAPPIPPWATPPRERR